MSKGPAHIQDLLRAIEGFAAHIDRLNRDQGLLGEVRGRLPVAIRSHCLQARLKDGLLVLTLDSSSWATRVRYLEGALVESFAKKGVVAVRTQVRPPGRADRRVPLRPKTATGGLTPATVSHLLGAADHIADPGLAEAIRRLARGHAGLRPTRGVGRS